MVGHWVSLPKPDRGSVLRVPIHESDFAEALENSKLSIFHFLYKDCSCSQRVFQYLIQRKAHPVATEVIVMIDGNTAQRKEASDSGFMFFTTTPEKLFNQFGIESAPLLVASNPSSVIQYSGGYTSRKQGLDFIDGQVIEDLLAGKQVYENPVYGCGVSEQLKDIVDPFRIRSF